MANVYRSTTWMPALVEQATGLAERLAFRNSCSPEVGRLLCVLAGQVGPGPIGELGTGCGVGTAWMAAGMRPGTLLHTVELDSARARAAAKLFASTPGVRVTEGDWHGMLEHGPFALLFADAAKAKEREPETLLRALLPGGLVVLDDLSPEEQWPPEWQGRRDAVRDFWLNDPRLAATEVRVTAASSVILATRLP